MAAILLLQSTPLLKQTVPFEDAREFPVIEHAQFDEAKNAVFIPRAPDLQGDGGKVLGGEDAGGDAAHVALDSGGQRLFDERRAGRDEFDRPAFDDDELALGLAAACEQVIVNRAEREQRPARLRGEDDKNVEILRGDEAAVL